MIRGLKKKFILLSMLSLLFLLSAIVTGMNLINYSAVVSEADDILSLLSENKGRFPEFRPGDKNRFPRDMSPETPYESRYFSVLLGKDGNIIHTETSKITAVDSHTAIEYAELALGREDDRGFIGDYRYRRTAEGERTNFIFLDCGRKLSFFHTFLYVSIGMALMGLLLVFLVITVLSGRIIRPIAESYEKQKQFITDAGHEIRTPLTIIKANADLLEMELGENECLGDIRQQTERLGMLTNDLVMLARMEETEKSMPKIDFPLSEVVAEAANPFRAPAVRQEKTLVCRIQPMLSLNGNEKAIGQLVSILMDNALKYSPAGGVIELQLSKHAKTVCLSISNTVTDTVNPKQLDHIFDRFYRVDAARSTAAGGYGIGLAIARAIVTAHNGKIQASQQSGGPFTVSVSFPA